MAPTEVRRGSGPGRTLPQAVPAVAALTLGLWGIDRHNSMWRDESVSYQVAHRSLGDLWGLLGNIDAVHGLYYLLMHAVFGLWDGGLVALRLPSTLATALAAAGVAAIGARLAGRRAGTLAGLVFALLPMTQHYAQEGRSYALVTAAVTWATYFLVRAMSASRARWWTAYALTLALACWLHEFAVFALVAHGLTLCRLRVPRQVWRRWGVAALSAGLSLLPLVAVSAGQADEQLTWLTRPSPSQWLQYAAIAVTGILLRQFLVRGPAAAQRGGARELTALALPLLVVPAGLLMTLSYVRPWYVDRYVLYGMAGLALLVGAALSRAVGQRHRLPPVLQALTVCVAATAAVAVLLPWALLIRSPESRKDDVVAVTHAVQRTAHHGDGVLFMPGRRREWLLSYPQVLHRLDDLALAESPAASRTLQGTELPADEIRRRILAQHRIIALSDPAGQPLDPFPREEVKRRTLGAYFEECGRTRVHGARITVYVRRGHCTQ
ncbi:glycosyltransferase family 39 protein [Streptomyces coacervatus]|uniref:glycosyltransferase family 39 protein n=1 Tax=Streptomyces coacervatus TaxID=647381 RepID=UPI0023DB1C7F|nr:glycosyltransferase family 39 protein [Streptomyces coacervatus]MDF2268854.1 glycosyltransferase family 39 protein [Streptomyces coacervatus]